MLTLIAALVLLTPDWVVTRSTDPMTDEATVSATVRTGREALAVICGPGRAFYVRRVSGYSLAAEQGDALAYRVDSLPAANHGWQQRGNSAIIEHDAAARMSFQMMGGVSVLTRLVLSGGGSSDQSFTLAGSREAILQVRRACGIPDAAGS